MGGGILLSLFVPTAAGGQSFLIRKLVMAAEGGKDCLGDLIDDLLRHLLFLLQPEGAPKTCVLDTRWRELCRRTTSLHSVSLKRWL
ncbi:hypothetical protein CFC21_074494 [Triticum aestivum]|uniref:Secreted protein n=3 Tax=Triticum TaxID=4564 RepID=A0A9R0XMJ0_TRITD|nr:hypothetical protein CFC21_074494 [Triticum aestivum]VAI39108.1 unnamed protein product [Triticum turgidum subsp. durum]